MFAAQAHETLRLERRILQLETELDRRANLLADQADQIFSLRQTLRGREATTDQPHPTGEQP